MANSMNFDDLPEEILRLEVFRFVDEPTRYCFSLTSKSNYAKFGIDSNFGTRDFWVEHARNGTETFLEWIFVNLGYWTTPRCLFPLLLEESLSFGNIKVFDYVMSKSNPEIISKVKLSMAAGKSGSALVIQHVEEDFKVKLDFLEVFLGACSVGSIELLELYHSKISKSQLTFINLWAIACRSDQETVLWKLIELFPEVDIQNTNLLEGALLGLVFQLKNGEKIIDFMIEMSKTVSFQVGLDAIRYLRNEELVFSIVHRATQMTPANFQLELLKTAAEWSTPQIFNRILRSIDYFDELEMSACAHSAADCGNLALLKSFEGKIDFKKLFGHISSFVGCHKNGHLETFLYLLEKAECDPMTFPYVNGMFPAEPSQTLIEYHRKRLQNITSLVNRSDFEINSFLAKYFLNNGDFKNFKIAWDKFLEEFQKEQWQRQNYELGHFFVDEAYKLGHLKFIRLLGASLYGSESKFMFYDLFSAGKRFEAEAYFHGVQDVQSLQRLEWPFGYSLAYQLHLGNAAVLEFFHKKKVVISSQSYSNLFRRIGNTKKRTVSERILGMVDWLLDHVSFPSMSFVKEFRSWLEKIISVANQEQPHIHLDLLSKFDSHCAALQK
jgi:hypothetical protein